MEKYKYILMIRNNAFRGEEMGVSLSTNSQMILQKHIAKLLSYGNIDFKVFVNTEIEENENENEIEL